MNWIRLVLLVSLGVVLLAAVIVPSCEACVKSPSANDLPQFDRAGSARMRERTSGSGLGLGDEETARAELAGSEAEESVARLEEAHLQVESAFGMETRAFPVEEPESLTEGVIDHYPPPEEEPPPQVDEAEVEAWFDKFDGVDWLEPGSIESALLGGARSAFLNERYEFAIELLQELLKAEPGYGPAHALLGTSHAHLGRRREAAFHYQRFVELSPEHPQAEDAVQILEEYDRSLRDRDR